MDVHEKTRVFKEYITTVFSFALSESEVNTLENAQFTLNANVKPQVTAASNAIRRDVFEFPRRDGLWYAVKSVYDVMPWEVGYSVDDPDLAENFSYGVLIGDGGLFQCDDVALGITLIKPGYFYDWHRHPAKEFYVDLFGGARWGVDRKPLALKGAQEVVVHGSNQLHATQAQENPVVAPWLWIGDIKTKSSFVEIAD